MNLPRLYCPIFLWNNYNRLTLQFNLFSLRLLNIFTLCKSRCPFSYLKSSQYKTFNIFLIFIIFIKALAAWRVNKQYFGILIFFFFSFFFFLFWWGALIFDVAQKGIRKRCAPTTLSSKFKTQFEEMH